MSDNQLFDLRGEDKSRRREIAKGLKPAKHGGPKPLSHTGYRSDGTHQHWYEGHRSSIEVPLPARHRQPHFVRSQMKWTISRKQTAAQQLFRADVEEAALDDHNDDSSSDRSTAPSDVGSVPSADEHEVMYSYDHRRGPFHHDEQIDHVINRAVERFEAKETERAIKEYDFIFDIEDESGSVYVDDDFELVDQKCL